MAEGNAKITITGDATGLKTATGQASDSLNKMKSGGEETGKSISQQFQQSTGRVLGVAGAFGALLAAIMKAHDGIKGFINAQNELGASLKAITDAQKINTTAGEDFATAALKNAARIRESQLADLEIEKAKRNIIEDATAAMSGYAEDRLKAAQVETAYKNAVEDVNTALKNQADLRKAQEAGGRFDQIKKIELMKAELRGDEAKAQVEGQFKLLEIQRELAKALSEDRKQLLREEYDLQVQLNAQAAAAELEAWYANQALKEAAEAEAEKKLFNQRIDNEKKIADERAKREREQLGSARSQLGGIVTFGRNAQWMMNGGRR